MKMNIMKILVMIVMFSSILSSNFVLASTLPQLQIEKNELNIKQNAIESDIRENESSMSENRNEVDSLLAQIISMNSEIAAIELDITEKETIIFETMGEVENLYNSIIGLKSITTERDIVLRERLRAIQINGGTINYIDVLIGASSFANFIDRFNAVTTLLEADRKMIRQQGEDQEHLEIIKTQIDTKLSEQQLQKHSIQTLRSSMEDHLNEKELLIDELERTQQHLAAERIDLQVAFDETYKLSEDIERAILAEQQYIFQNEQQRFTAGYCQQNGEVNEELYFNKLKNAGVFNDQGPLLLNIAKEYGIDPILFTAIAFHETTIGTSNAAVLYNNPGGLMDPAQNWEALLRFDTLEEGLRSMGKTLKRLILKEGRVTIQKLGSAYAPLEAINDPLGLNEYWVPNVTKQVKALGGLTMNCDEQLTSMNVDNGKWIAPTTGTFTSQFGNRSDPFTGQDRQHRGLDIANSVGTPIVAAGKGIVSRAKYHDSYGNMVMITHVVGNDVYTTVYAHLSAISVQEGQQVEAGQLIGQMGSTGRSTGPHLHFEFHVGYYSGSGPSAVNPLRYVAF